MHVLMKTLLSAGLYWGADYHYSHTRALLAIQLPHTHTHTHTHTLTEERQSRRKRERRVRETNRVGGVDKLILFMQHLFPNQSLRKLMMIMMSSPFPRLGTSRLRH